MSSPCKPCGVRQGPWLENAANLKAFPTPGCDASHWARSGLTRCCGCCGCHGVPPTSSQPLPQACRVQQGNHGGRRSAPSLGHRFLWAVTWMGVGERAGWTDHGTGTPTVTDWGSIRATKWDHRLRQAGLQWGPSPYMARSLGMPRLPQALTGPQCPPYRCSGQPPSRSEPAESLQPWLAPTAEFPCKQEEVP